jgi:hypothetical protein
MIIEMRTYKLKPGTRTRFLDMFQSKVCPGAHGHRHEVLGPFVSVDDPDMS